MILDICITGRPSSPTFASIVYCGVARDLFQTSKGTYLAWRQTWILGFPGVDGQRGQRRRRRREEKKRKDEGLCGTRSCVTSVTSLRARVVLAIVIQFHSTKEPLFLEHVTAAPYPCFMSNVNFTCGVFPCQWTLLQEIIKGSLYKRGWYLISVLS